MKPNERKLNRLNRRSIDKADPFTAADLETLRLKFSGVWPQMAPAFRRWGGLTSDASSAYIFPEFVWGDPDRKAGEKSRKRIKNTAANE